MNTLHGKTVLVTGASGNLGRHVVESCLAVGARVIAGARRRTQLDALRSSLDDHERLDVAEVDVTHEPGVCKLFRDVTASGSLDGVVHCAGAFAYGSLVEMPSQTVEHLFHLNTLGTAWILKSALRAMVPQGSGSIVVIAADRAVEPGPGFSVYGASKAAAAHLVVASARETEASGVRVNGLLPGTLNTEDNRQAMPETDPRTWASPAAVARTVVWLLSDEARGTSGALIHQSSCP